MRAYGYGLTERLPSGADRGAAEDRPETDNDSVTANGNDTGTVNGNGSVSVTVNENVTVNMWIAVKIPFR